MEGLYFWGFAWSLWIIATFILNKQSNIRLPLSILVLLTMIITPYTFIYKEYTISYVCLFMLLIVFIKISSLSFGRKLYFFLTSLIISIGYVTFLLFELFDPIWIIVKREWMLAFIIAYLSVLLQKRLILRFTSILIGCIYGDILFAIIIYRFSFPYDIGSLRMLDVCSVASLMLFGWEGVKTLIGYFESQYQTIEREKEKTT